MTVQNAAKPARVTKRRAETRARLLDAAYRVFADKGFGRVRIEDVCAAAGYTRGAFYSQFASLEELFFTLYDERAALIAEQLTEALADPDSQDTPESALNRVTATLLLDRDWLLVKSDFHLHAARNLDVSQRLLAHRSQLRTVIEERIAQSGAALSDELGTPRDAARAVIAAYDGVATQLLLDGDVPAARAWLHQLLSALLAPG